MRREEAVQVTTMKAGLRAIAVCGVLVLCNGLASARGRGASPAGELFLQDPQSLALQTRGEPVRAGDVVRTGTEGGVVRLEEQAVMRLDPNSAVVFDRGPSGISVHVLSGRASVVGPSGRILHGGAGSRFALPETGQDADVAERLLLDEGPAVPRQR